MVGEVVGGVVGGVAVAVAGGDADVVEEASSEHPKTPKEGGTPTKVIGTGTRRREVAAVGEGEGAATVAGAEGAPGAVRLRGGAAGGRGEDWVPQVVIPAGLKPLGLPGGGMADKW